jgi:apoptosis-inducing factor 3
MTDRKTPDAPDLAHGVQVADLQDGVMLSGLVGDESVLLVRRGEQFFAISATCTHYGGPSARDWWLMTPSDARGTTPALANARS